MIKTLELEHGQKRLVKLLIKNKGGTGIRGLKKIFHEHDSQGLKRLDPYDFEQALASFG